VTLGGITVAALIAICSAPLVIAALAPWWLGEPLTPRTLAALGLGVAGTACLIVGPAAPAASSRALAGALLALLAGLAYALFVLTAKAGLARSAPLPLTALAFAVGALLLSPALLWTPAPLDQLAAGWPWLLYLGGIATAGAYAAYGVGLRRVPASVAGVTSLLEPLTATALGVTLFDERLGAGGGLGALLLVSALGVLLVDRS
jgi:DME family drug/metabolite transporter